MLESVSVASVPMVSETVSVPVVCLSVPAVSVVSVCLKALCRDRLYYIYDGSLATIRAKA